MVVNLIEVILFGLFNYPFTIILSIIKELFVFHST